MFSQETAVRRNSYVSESDVSNRNRHSRSISGTQTFHITTDSSVNVVSKLEPTEVKDVLVCFLFVLKYSSQDQLISWWRYCTEPDIVAFFKIIEYVKLLRYNLIKQLHFLVYLILVINLSYKVSFNCFEMKHMPCMANCFV